MDIIISQRLRELRHKKGNTQEELADFLSISTAAVSKWERNETYPDLTLIPRIASFYDVTVDDLLGVDEVRKKERLSWYYAESMKLQRVGKITESVALWHEAQKEFPNDLSVMSNLSFALCFQVRPDIGSYKEAIALDERILEKSTDQAQRSKATELLCRAYSAIGDKKRAIEYAETANSLFHSSELMKLDVLEGEEKDRLAKWLVENITSTVCMIVMRDINSVDWLYRYEFIIRLLELVYDDDMMGSSAEVACTAHYFCAKSYAECDDEEKVRYHLRRLADYLDQKDGLHGEFTYTSTILAGLSDNADNYVTNAKLSDREIYRNFLTEEDSGIFDSWRETDWFRDVIGRLSK